MFEKIKERYEKFYVTDAQLEQYVRLGVITQAQAESLRAARELEETVNIRGGGYSDDLTVRLPNGYHVIFRAVGV